ncbi:hypothetical protein HPB48_014194 [Haemaphysalis longicornis]|uniref:Uncharacterized protein n=1 Tax=Haemaphysalis longicornis TaxID=44386 RepID=A0A9J6FKM8_HAELO|nr:hypothetical protein HPB48_014194 [Haemaphysalis longicornis]
MAACIDDAEMNDVKRAVAAAMCMRAKRISDRIIWMELQRDLERPQSATRQKSVTKSDEEQLWRRLPLHMVQPFVKRHVPFSGVGGPTREMKIGSRIPCRTWLKLFQAGVPRGPGYVPVPSGVLPASATARRHDHEEGNFGGKESRDWPIQTIFNRRRPYRRKSLRTGGVHC